MSRPLAGTLLALALIATGVIHWKVKRLVRPEPARVVVTSEPMHSDQYRREAEEDTDTSVESPRSIRP